MKNLLEKSDIYYKNASIYEAFAQAEDAPALVYQALLPIFKGKNILDIGCGTGKYLKLFAPHVKSILGLDAAEDQLSIAKEKIKDYSNVEIICSDAAEASFSKLYDIAFASWMLGTITDGQKRLLVLDNIKLSLNKNGKLFLVENDIGGEFEDIRGRINDPLERTKSYNHWLQQQGFQIVYKLTSYFEFTTIQEAKSVIKAIWGVEAAQKVTSKRINHPIVIFFCSI